MKKNSPIILTGSVSPIPLSETTIIERVDDNLFFNSNNSDSYLFVDFTLGSLTSADLKFYTTLGEKDGGGNLIWYSINVPMSLTSNTKQTYSFAELNGSFKYIAKGYKITITGAGTVNTGSSVKVNLVV